MNIHLLSFSQRRFIFLPLVFLLLFSSYCLGQTTCNTTINPGVCTGNIAQNFNTSNGSFSSSSFVYNAANGRWELNNPNFITAYSISSSNFKLAINGLVQVGFTFARIRGTCFVGNNGFTIRIIDNSNGQTLALCTNVTISNGNTVCASIADARLIPGKAIHYVISFRTSFPCPSSALAFDNFSVGSSAIPSPIPVTLTSFTAKRENNSITLKWQTASEFNNHGFEIDRKLPGQGNFETIALVPSKKADGNSSELLNYEYSDINISGDVSQYRLKQVDFDGKYKFSDILLVKGTTAAGRILIYPNPSSQGTVNIVFDSFDKKDIQLTDINGRMQQKWEGYSSGQLLLHQLRPGVYLLHVTDLTSNNKVIRKIVIL